ncbi:hypothetical protein [Rhizobium oryzihabitans]|uniref:hypothetical protein n=1 Tax=Rhizobium oryzihabitans TaxID=2267833 RepID=UPI0040358550
MISRLFAATTEEDFNLSANGWFQLTLIAAALGFIFFLCSGITVATQPDAETKQKISQAFAPFLVGAVAIVTFCAAIWRGKLNSEQIKQQKRQNDAKDDENLASLLVDGTKLINEDKESHHFAGIATLQAVACSKNEVFAVPAMDILADVVMDTYNDKNRVYKYMACRRALRAASGVGHTSNRTIKIDLSSEPQKPIPTILGCSRLRVTGGTIAGSRYEKIRTEMLLELRDATVKTAVVAKEAWSFKGCAFIDCHIKFLAQDFIENNSFTNCDFSGAETSKIGLTDRDGGFLKKLENAGNYYVTGTPPETIGNINPTLALQAKSHGRSNRLVRSRPQLRRAPS